MTKKSNDDSVRKTKPDPYHSFLESLKGKEVTIYRGGPESKSGVLLDVQSDFVTVFAQNNNNNNNNNDNNNKNNNNKNQNKNQNNAQNNNQNNQNQNVVVYYNIRHIASISENSVSNSTLNLQQQGTTETQTPEFLQSDSFTGVVQQLEGKYIQINQGGPEAKTGQVLGVIDDYIVLFAEDDGVVYFNVQHIKSILEYNENNQDQNNGNNANMQNTQTVVPEFENVGSFHDIFGRMSHKWIAINRGGPEAMEGILVENAGGHYTLINNQEVMRINPYHIKSISSGPKGSLQQNNQNDQNDQQNNQQQNNDASAQSQNNENKSEDKKQSESKKRSSRSSKERVTKTIDYVWKSK